MLKSYFVRNPFEKQIQQDQKEKPEYYIKEKGRGGRVTRVPEFLHEDKPYSI